MQTKTEYIHDYIVTYFKKFRSQQQYELTNGRYYTVEQLMEYAEREYENNHKTVTNDIAFTDFNHNPYSRIWGNRNRIFNR